MLQEKPLTVDFTKEGAALQVFPRPPVLTSYQSKWNGIYVEYHQQPAWENREFCTTQHVIAIHQFANSLRHRIKMERVLDGRKQNEQLGYGEIVITPAHVATRGRWDREIDCIALMLEPTHIARIAHESVDGDRVELIPHFAKPDPVIHQISLLLKSELESNGLGSRLYVDGLTTTLSVHLLRNYCTLTQTIQEYRDGLPKYKLKLAIEYINAHLEQDIQLADLAELLGMSRYYFVRLFKQSMGVTPYQYVLQQRIERAKMLLKHRETAISDISLECGFANQSHFTKHFRQFTGMTPKAYQNR
ncbi:helix-turn-helix domain-containing protein [Scytonema sp. PCC 10023]|uniref:helix-turn-helix transcriptional regulator n=1 Tax=Scytonema sp. PCC 10023 TaxID=1680591 RepID=UPI0039C6686D